MKARKGQGTTAPVASKLPDRTAAPAEATAPPSGPPRLTVGGNRPTWREKEAARREGESRGKQDSASPAPSADAEPPRRSGYVPPALRDGSGAGAGSGGVGGGADKWRSREREDRVRDDSPASNAASTGGRFASARGFNRDRDTDSQSSATGPSKSVLQGMRGERRPVEREEKGSPVLPAAEPTDGKYRPGAFKSRRTQGQ